MYARVQAMFRASGVEQLDNATFEHAVRVLVLHQQHCSTTSYSSQSEPLEEPSESERERGVRGKILKAGKQGRRERRKGRIQHKGENTEDA